MRTGILGVLLLTFALSARAADYRPIVIDPSYDHDRYNTQPKDVLRVFRAFMVSFDGRDDDDGDGGCDILGIPEWVAFEIKRHPDPPRSGPDRPSRWITDEPLFERGIAPNDDSYRNSGFDRGHLCRKLTAFRLGADADWNTHTFLNACPQRAELNRGIWLYLENKTPVWADRYGAVWVICGPVFYDNDPIEWVGDPGELPIAIPDAYFKVVVRKTENPNRPEVLCFLFEHFDPRIDHLYNNRRNHSIDDDDLSLFFASIDTIEARTGLDFLTALPDAAEADIERATPVRLWD